MLQFITHPNSRHSYADGTAAVLEGGCRWVQLRMKDADDDEFIRTGRTVGQLCRRAGATFILDDRVHLVELLNADGVHLGLDDMPVDEARHILGPDKIIGATANTLAHMLAADKAGADYIGLGPFRFTTTKQRLSPILGIEGYRETMRAFRRTSALPVVAIGGITNSDIAPLAATGISGIAMSGALLNSPDISETTGKIMQILSEHQL